MNQINLLINNTLDSDEKTKNKITLMQTKILSLPKEIQKSHEIKQFIFDLQVNLNIFDLHINNNSWYIIDTLHNKKIIEMGTEELDIDNSFSKIKSLLQISKHNGQPIIDMGIKIILPDLQNTNNDNSI